MSADSINWFACLLCLAIGIAFGFALAAFLSSGGKNGN